MVDLRTGRVLRSYDFAASDTFVNDVVLTKRFAWFTDSQQAQLYGLPLGRGGRLPRASQVVTLPLTGDWEQMWRSAQVGHAAVNNVYVAAVNRVGREDAITFWGGSFVAGPDGAVMAKAHTASPVATRG